MESTELVNSTEKIYAVVVKNKDLLDEFYNLTTEKNIKIYAQKPLSLITQCILTSEQVQDLSQNSIIEDIFLTPESSNVVPEVCGEPYNITGNFHKGYSDINSNLRQWGHLHCAGSEDQRRKGVWDSGSVYDSVEIFSNGKDIDVIIVDEPVSFDCGEWLSSINGVSRFVQYQWFNELNDLVFGTAKPYEVDGIPTGLIEYHSNSENPYSHGNHVAGTICGKHYGWAREANIYSLPVLGKLKSGQQVPGSLAYDYIRAFHKIKPVNPVTGMKNPTIVNHSWGYHYTENFSNKTIDDIVKVEYRGVTYDKNNPGPSGWTISGINADFGLNLSGKIPADIGKNFLYDIAEATQEGIISIGAAMNDNFFCNPYDKTPGQYLKSFANPYSKLSTNFIDYTEDATNTLYFISSIGQLQYLRYCRGGSPGNDPLVITVGALSDSSDFRRANFSNFGPLVDVFAPGDSILSCVSSTYTGTKYYDLKYGGNNYIASWRGTSMASPQVAGLAAMLASRMRNSYPRFTYWDFLGYLQQNSIKDDMTFDINDGSFNDVTCQKGSPNSYMALQKRKLSGQLEMQIHFRNFYQKYSLLYPRKPLLMTSGNVAI